MTEWGLYHLHTLRALLQDKCNHIFHSIISNINKTGPKIEQNLSLRHPIVNPKAGITQSRELNETTTWFEHALIQQMGPRPYPVHTKQMPSLVVSFLPIIQSGWTINKWVKKSFEKLNKKQGVYGFVTGHRQNILGATNSICRKLSLENQNSYWNFFRMETNLFWFLLNKVKATTIKWKQKKGTNMRGPIPAESKHQAT